MLKKGKNNQGFSMIEILVVIAIMAMTLGITVSFMGDIFGTQIKKETNHLVATILYAYNESVTKGTPFRLVFDLTEQQYWLESGPEVFVIDPEPQEIIKKKKKSPQKNQADDDTKDSEAENKTSDTDTAKPPPAFAEADAEVFKKVKLDDVVKIRDVFVAHQKELVEEGQAFLYFFPSGLTQMAVIHLSNEEQTRNYSVIVNPITGRCRVEADYIEYENLFEK